jgi:hypothetical protein
MAAILDSLGFTFLIDRMTEVLTPDIYIELTGVCWLENAVYVNNLLSGGLIASWHCNFNNENTN